MSYKPFYLIPSGDGGANAWKKTDGTAGSSTNWQEVDNRPDASTIDDTYLKIKTTSQGDRHWIQNPVSGTPYGYVLGTVFHSLRAMASSNQFNSSVVFRLYTQDGSTDFPNNSGIVFPLSFYTNRYDVTSLRPGGGNWVIEEYLTPHADLDQRIVSKVLLGAGATMLVSGHWLEFSCKANTKPVVRYPKADIYAGWTSTEASHWDAIDDLKGSPDTGSYIKANSSATFWCLASWDWSNSIPTTATRISVRLVIDEKGEGIFAGVNYKIRCNSASITSVAHTVTNTSYATWSTLMACPVTGGWKTKAGTGFNLNDVNAMLEFGAEYGGYAATVFIAQAYLEISWLSFDTVLAPSTLQCDYQTTPTNVSETPVFSAIHHDVEANSAASVSIQVCTHNGFIASVGPSDFVLWTATLDQTIADGVRSSLIPYAGATLSSSPPNLDNWYFWKIRFANGLGVGPWSDTYQFSGINRDWADSNCLYRKRITFGTSHPTIDKGITVDFNFKTGNRQIIARDGHFNEAMQASGAQQVCYVNQKTHVVYLAKMPSDVGYLVCKVVTYDNILKTWGEPFEIYQTDTSYDSHSYPVIQEDSLGYLHVFWSDHGNLLYYLRSENINDSTSWIDPATGLGIPATFSNASHTYPIPWVSKNEGIERIYVSTRGKDSGYTFAAWGAQYSDDYGETWSDRYYFIDDKGTSPVPERVYAYGIRYDSRNSMLHMQFTINSSNPGKGGTPEGIWYVYSTLNANTPEWFHTWRDASGEMQGVTSTNDSYASLLGRGTFPTYCIIPRDGSTSCFCEDLVLIGNNKPLILFQYDSPIMDYAYEANIRYARWSTDIGTNGHWNLATLTTGDIPKLRVRRSGVTGVTDRDGNIHLYYAVRGKHTSFDGDWTAAEMVEVVSQDDGDTWELNVLTENSGVGVPIVSCKHELTNDTSDVVWCSGHDVFYMDNSKYNKVTSNARDLKIYCGGTQIDRVMDYTNLDSSNIMFQIQATISANRETGKDDYYVYYGFPDVVATPLSDPDNVFGHLSDNFEDLTEGDVLESVYPHWIDDSYSVTKMVVYASPTPDVSFPNHSNKVGAGEKCVYGASGVYNGAHATLNSDDGVGSGLSNFYMSAYLWSEDTGSASEYYYIQAQNNVTGSVFRVGGNMQYASSYNYASYFSGDVSGSGNWHDMIQAGCPVKNMHLFELHVTASGASGWVDGSLVVSNSTMFGGYPLIHGIKVFSSGGVLYYDKVLCYSKLPNDYIVLGTEERGYGFSISAVLQGADLFRFNISGSIGGTFLLSNANMELDISQTRVVGKTLLVDTSVKSSHIRQASIQTTTQFNKDAQTILELLQQNAVTSIGNTDTGVLFQDNYYNTNIDIGDNISPELQTVIDLGKGTSQGIDLPIDASQHRAIVLQALIDLQSSVSVDQQVEIDTSVVLQNDVVAMLESLSASPPVDVQTIVETMVGLDSVKQLVLENGFINIIGKQVCLDILTTNSEITTQAAIEVLKKSSIDRILPIAVQKILKTNKNLPIYFAGVVALEVAGILPIGWDQIIEQAAQTVTGVLKSTDINKVLPITVQKILKTDKNSPMSFSGATALEVADLPISWDQIIEQVTQAPIETGIKASSYVQSVIDQIASVAQSGSLPLDWKKQMEVDGVVNVEHGVLINLEKQLVMEVRQSLAATPQTPIDFSGATTLVVSSLLPINWLSKLVQDGDVSIETGALLSNELQTAVETCIKLSSDSQIPADWLQKLSKGEQLPIKILYLIASQFQAGMETGVSLLVDKISPIEVVTTTVTIDVLGSLPISWLSSVVSDDQVLIGTGRKIESISSILTTEFGRKTGASLQSPILFGNSLASSQSAIISLIQKMDHELQAGVETGTLITVDNQLPVEFLTGVVRLLTTMGMPIEWYGYILHQIMARNAKLFGPDIGGNLLHVGIK